MHYIITVDSNTIPESVEKRLNIPYGCYNYITFKDMDIVDVHEFISCLNDYATPLLYKEAGEDVQLFDI